MAARMNERKISVNGADLWMAEQGEGSPLVLCTGGPGLCDYLGPVATMVDDIAHVYRFDPRGCGRSSATPPYDMPTLLTDLEALRIALGHERWIVGGHSFGADLALAYALEYSDRAHGLIYISGTGVQDDRQWHAAYETGRAAGQDPLPVFEYPFNPEVNRAVNTSWRSYIKHPLLLRRISDLCVPVLSLHGGKDIRPPWPVQQFANLLPSARYEVIQDAPHCPWLTHAADMRSRLRAFLHDVGCLQ